jgi:DNA-binding NarL/FixJ family response regulator
MKMNKYSGSVWLLDDDQDRRNLFMEEFKEHLEPAESIEKITKWFSNINEAQACQRLPPDVLILDICLVPGEERIVTGNISPDILKSLADISGISFLTKLRNEWPKLPVILISGYWQKRLPSLTQHALCVVKPEDIGYEKMTELIRLAQMAVIGIKKTSISDKLQGAIDKLNSAQDHFYFTPFSSNNDLLVPPQKLFTSDLYEKHLRLLYEIWNNRILSTIENMPENVRSDPPRSTHAESAHPILPFSRHPLTRFYSRFDKDIDYMGSDYFESFFFRECARAAYSTYFSIKPHPVDTGHCIFDSSTYPPDLKKGVIEGKICPECRAQMVPYHAFGGWSKGRDEAANAICRLAKESLPR